jgi:hypothetical protein
MVLGSLDSVLCRLADLGKSLMEPQDVHQVSLEALRTYFLYLPLCTVPNWMTWC